MLFVKVAVLSSCVPQLFTQTSSFSELPPQFQQDTSSKNIGLISWKDYFGDKYLQNLIETALEQNQELKIFLQEIEIQKSEIKARKGEYLPFVELRSNAELDKVGKYTRNGALENQLNILPNKPFPTPFSDLMVGTVASWEIDIWKRLRNARKSAVMRYMASQEGRNFLVTNLVAEIASLYYELLALDNILEIIQQNATIQENAYQIIKQEKENAKVTQLAVNRFEAQVFNTKNLAFEIKQQIVQTENRINFLLGRFPQPIERNSKSFFELSLDSIEIGLPSQLLSNRPDIKRAELELKASKLDVEIAKANFYPSLRLVASAGFQAFSPKYIFEPHSILYRIGGEILSPLINRNAIKAVYLQANARQLQALYHYQQTILNAFVDVLNQLASIQNFQDSYKTKQKEVEILNESIDIASNLYRFARADYMEVLLTQREALNAKLELAEAKRRLLFSKVGIYRALGGGYQ